MVTPAVYPGSRSSRNCRAVMIWGSIADALCALPISRPPCPKDIASSYYKAMIRAYALLLLAGLCQPTQAATAIQLSSERRLSFNDGWRFFKGDAPGAERSDFQDAKWTQIQLPHDWAIEGPFDPQINPHTGALPISGTGWYRKWFTLPANSKDRFFSIEFDGAMSNAHVWLNGHELGGRPYGYIGFSFDLTPYLKFGAQENVLAVRLTPEERSSRWYPGAGIYRNVWLDVTGPVHVAHWGTYITTPAVSDEQATVDVKTAVRNRATQETRLTLQTSILDPSGRSVSRNGDMAIIPAGATQIVATNLTVTRPQRWDIDRPAMYSLVTEVMDSDKKVVDRYVTPFGIRTIAFDKAKGFLLNGRTVKIQGVCDHHDLGALGAAVNRRATERQLQILKGAGVNAIRTSHNPPSPELLEYCDRMGLLVMDEAFDMWRRQKVPNDYHKYFDEWSERDVRDMVHRDRNHPSIIMYSIGNEIPEQGSPDGGAMAKRLVDFFHQEDPTRPTTSAFNNPEAAIKNGLAAAVDIPGINYRPWQYETIQKEHPDWIVYGSETASCVSSRGVYHLPVEKYEKHPSLQLTGYDVIAPPWAYCPDVEFAYQDKLPNVLGEFVWTGFDYIGEPTPYFNGRGANTADWPSRSSYFGFVDLAGFPKDRYYLYQSVWTKKPMVHVLPHWNWKEGQTIPVMAYTNSDEVELFVNGKSLGRKKRFSEPVKIPVGPNASQDRTFSSKYRLEWQVPYQPGSLKAVAYQGGKQVAVDEIRTAGAPARVKLIPDRATIQADGDDLSFITVRIEDKDGNLCPMSDNLVKFTVTGAGSIRAVDNGNAATIEPFHADRRKAFSGMALLIVSSQKAQAGRIHVTAASEGLAEGAADITTRR
jgi:beta-galactosidase